MRSLLWKDYRLNRGLLMLGATALAGVYVVGAVIEISHTWPAMPAPRVCADALFSYGHLALSLTPFVAALLGGNAIACERSERSAHFLAYLPPTKAQILTSKVIVAAGALGLFWVAILLSTYVVAPLISPDPRDFMYISATRAAVAAGCLLTFGVGWLGSACLESAIFPAVFALASPVLLGFGLQVAAMIFGVSRFEVVEWAGSASFWSGALAFGAGTWCYLHRVEP